MNAVDMFRSLFEVQKTCDRGQTASVSALTADGSQGSFVESHLTAENMFTLVVDPDPNRKTVANYRIDEPSDVIDTLAKVSLIYSTLLKYDFHN